MVRNSPGAPEPGDAVDRCPEALRTQASRPGDDDRTASASDADADTTTGTDAGASTDSLATTVAAQEIFGERYGLARRYAELLVTDGVLRGLVGPREAPRIWERHILNCAVVGELIPHGSRVVDVGSGAGLPGIVLAIARPDLTVTLVDSLARRTSFLTEVAAELGLADQVSVYRGRAEEMASPPEADVVTARAVAPLDRLATWCLPLLKHGGRLLAIKGVSAADEAGSARAAVRAAGGGDPVVRHCGHAGIGTPTTVIEVIRERNVGPASRGGTRARSARPRPGRAGR